MPEALSEEGYKSEALHLYLLQKGLVYDYVLFIKSSYSLGGDLISIPILKDTPWGEVFV